MRLKNSLLIDLFSKEYFQIEIKSSSLQQKTGLFPFFVCLICWSYDVVQFHYKDIDSIKILEGVKY